LRVTIAFNDPGVGYALTYPIGVVFGILAVQLKMVRRRKSPKDKVSASSGGLTDLTIVVERAAHLADVNAWADRRSCLRGTSGPAPGRAVRKLPQRARGADLDAACCGHLKSSDSDSTPTLEAAACGTISVPIWPRRLSRGFCFSGKNFRLLQHKLNRFRFEVGRVAVDHKKAPDLRAKPGGVVRPP